MKQRRRQKKPSCKRDSKENQPQNGCLFDSFVKFLLMHFQGKYTKFVGGSRESEVGSQPVFIYNRLIPSHLGRMWDSVAWESRRPTKKTAQRLLLTRLSRQFLPAKAYANWLRVERERGVGGRKGGSLLFVVCCFLFLVVLFVVSGYWFVLFAYTHAAHRVRDSEKSLSFRARHEREISPAQQTALKKDSLLREAVF